MALQAGERHAVAIVKLARFVRDQLRDNRRDEHAVSSSTRRIKNCFKNIRVCARSCRSL
jgi:hypothetical protein